jgi:Flp pilus assembly protein TadD
MRFPHCRRPRYHSDHAGLLTDAVTDSVIRGVALALLMLLGACSARNPNGVGSGPPGIDIADAALKGGSPEIALEISSNILAHNPSNADALLTKGEALSALGRNDEAAAAFSAVLAGDPQSVSANIGLGRLLLSTDPAHAEELFLRALAREPRNQVALNDLGIARDLQGRHTDAQTAYRQALGLDPEMTAAQVNLALSLAMSGQSHDAVQLLRPLANKPNATEQTRHDLAAVLTMSGDRAEAEKILSRDLPPDQVQQALSAYATAQPNAAAAMMNPGPVPQPASLPAAASTQQAPVAQPMPSDPAPAAAVLARAVPVAPAALPQQPAAPPAPLNPAPAPAVAASAAPAAQPPAQETPASTASGAVQVQLAGPVASKSAAEVKWERLARAFPDALGGQQPVMAEVDEHGHTVWRVRAGGFADSGSANSFCERVRSSGTSCKVLE